MAVIAEESDLIVTLGEWAIAESCRQMAAWQKTMDALAPKRMCINLSRKQFVLPDLSQRIERIVTATGVDPRQLQFEVTEDAFVGDINSTVKTMDSIKDLGSELAIDGFGSGSSSFASLHQFPVDVLKIDRAMMSGIEDSNEVASVIHGLAVMVKNLGLDLVAEGVENPGQLIALQELGCDYAQGFFFAEGLTPEAMPEFAARSLSFDCQARGALAYANQWGERLAVFESFVGQEPSGSP
jgi:EAL domain-containing protein (putative c-di-GMP-specific phosphodiesterase class I)